MAIAEVKQWPSTILKLPVVTVHNHKPWAVVMVNEHRQNLPMLVIWKMWLTLVNDVDMTTATIVQLTMATGMGSRFIFIDDRHQSIMTVKRLSYIIWRHLWYLSKKVNDHHLMMILLTCVYRILKDRAYDFSLDSLTWFIPFFLRRRGGDSTKAVAG